MSDRYPREGEETGASAESTTPYISRHGVEGGQDPQAPTPTRPEDETEEERKQREEDEQRKRRAS